MTEAIEIVYESVKPRLGEISLDEFMGVFKDWDVLPIIRNQEIIGAVMKKGSEMHIAIHPRVQNKVYLRGLIRKALEKTLKEHGKVTTKVVKSHLIGHKLALMAGFKKVNEIDGIIEYECVEVKL